MVENGAWRAVSGAHGARRRGKKRRRLSFLPSSEEVRLPLLFPLSSSHGEKKRRRTSFFSLLSSSKQEFPALTTLSLVLSRWVEDTSRRQRSIAAGEPAC